MTLAGLVLAVSAGVPAIAADFAFNYGPGGVRTSHACAQGQGAFSFSYGPGGVPLCSKPAAKSNEVATPTTIKTSIPAADIKTAIEETALRYAGNNGLCKAGLSVTDWMALFSANIAVESNYRQSSISHAGAIGLGQLMPETAAHLGVDPRDPKQNLDGSARYLLMQLDRFGSKELALAAYNAGPDAVTRHGGIPPYAETQGHVRKVMAVYHRLKTSETTDRK
ncbi:lytic transglycosylase domain-containing protein [Martelella sp. HB161492]|uniref:lytic transglycosylase domain-containing protein n=1 Tax=Martelella sp. HB161492 TaxID=2720726 RepID=UPI001FEE8D3F|nr:lytic transglycosylase domain-containing protein [Martelella sp. HB161492]